MIHKRKISAEFNELLFKMWMDGKSLTEIYHHYMNTDQSFSFRTLLRVKTQNRWNERRQIILKQLSDEMDESLRIIRWKQLQSIQTMVEMNYDRIMNEYRKYILDPVTYTNKAEGAKVKPFWYCQSLKDLTTLIEGYNLAAFGCSGNLSDRRNVTKV